MGVVKLHGLHGIQQRRVQDARVAAVHGDGRTGHRRVQIAFGGLVIGAGQPQHFGIRLCLDRDGNQPARLAGDLPAAALALESEIDAAERNAPVLGLHQQDIADALPGHLLVGMAEYDGVDAGDLGRDLARHVLAAFAGGALQAGVHGDDDHIGPAPGLELGYGARRGVPCGQEAKPRVVLGFLPLRDGRRGDADDRDLHARDGLHDARRERFSSRARFGLGIGGKPGEPRVGAGLIEHLQTEIELVVAKRHRVVAKVVHRQHHRIGLETFGGQAQAQRQAAVAHVLRVNRLDGRALNGVAGIDQDAVRVLAAGGVDQGGQLGKPAVRRPRRVVVVRVDVAVQVGGGQHGDRDGLGAGGQRRG
ncbi:MAG: hypothetical protein NT090_23855 [Acidobacteria bacterium]|nr:hypothetical protein [Acidobacteriota bacterium]